MWRMVYLYNNFYKGRQISYASSIGAIINDIRQKLSLYIPEEKNDLEEIFILSDYMQNAPAVFFIKYKNELDEEVKKSLSNFKYIQQTTSTPDLYVRHMKTSLSKKSEKKEYAPGNDVMITSGIYANMTGVISTIEDNFALVIIKLFGYDTKISIPLNSIKHING